MSGLLLDTTVLIDLFRGKTQAADFMDKNRGTGTVGIFLVPARTAHSGQERENQYAQSGYATLTRPTRPDTKPRMCFWRNDRLNSPGWSEKTAKMLKNVAAHSF